MDFSWQFLSSSLTTFAFLLTVTVAQQSSILYDFCIDDKGNFTRNSTYEANLNRLLSSPPLDSIANDYGFYNISAGQGSDRANLIALCRGDVSSGDCLGCINNATTELRNRCPNRKEAIIWYDYCMLRYSNRSIFGLEESNPRFYMFNLNDVSNADAFNQALRALLDSLISNASSGNSLRKFATGSAEVTAHQTIYALVQCTPDLTMIECSSCLSQFVTLIPDCCDKKQGGRVIGPSCNFGFEITQFYNLTPADTPLRSPPPPPPSPSPPPPPPTPASMLSLPPSNDTASITGKESNSSRTIIIIAVSVVAVLVLLISTCIFFFLKLRKSKVKIETREAYEPGVDHEIRTAESIQYDFSVIRVATDNFSDANKLGRGGFGAVYKGKLASGELIAVKRLATDSGQGDVEFKNEVQLVAKLQHRNLVRLQGFCLERNERLLIYEFVPNASLDHFLFDPVKRAHLDWQKRYKIIGGIARGLLYLHEDSRLRIIHRDVKASNVLLDAQMNPKISDFGMARLCPRDQTQGATSKIAGTYGYMAPEYAMRGRFSAKSDVFSFGVLVLEILSGQKNNAFHNAENVEDHLLSYAWRNWKDGTALNLVDPSVRHGSRTELMRCIHIGLLCVQNNVAQRPNMTSVVLMLTSYSVTLPLPSKPAFFMYSNTQSNMMWSEGTNLGAKGSNQSRNEVAATISENDVTITELYPR